MSAYENSVDLELCCSRKKVTLPRGQVQEIRDPTKPLLPRDLEIAPMSFDAAAKEYIPMGDEGDIRGG